MDPKQNRMGWMPMPKLVVSMSLPLMFSLLIQSFYNIVDSIFVAKLGQNALTATTLAFPIQLLMIAVAVGTSIGINSLLSKSIGAKKFDQTKTISATGVFLALFGSIVFIVLGLFFSDHFVEMFTQDIVIAKAAKEYLSICMIFCAGTFIGTMFQRFLQSVGNTFGSMLTLVAGAVTNLILDPLLIFGLLGFPALGVKGAAIATIIGQWVSAIFAVLLNKFKNPLVQPKFKGFHLEKQILSDIYRVGFPTIITQALGSIMVSTINGILMPVSGTAVAFFGIYYKLQSFLFMPMNGLGQASIPIVSYNYGAKDKERILQAYRTTLPIAGVIALIATIVFLIFPQWLLGLFSANEEMMSFGVPALRIISLTFVLSAITMILGYADSGLGNGMINMISTALRQFILLCPAVYLLIKYASISNVWYAFWLSEVIAILYAAFCTLKLLKQKKLI